MQHVTNNIKKFRELKNLTREHMASQLEMSVSGYGKLERGEVELTVTKLFKLAEIFDVNVAQILNFDATKAFANSHRDEVDDGAQKEHVPDHDQYLDKYIALLEKEIERLQKESHFKN
jgi:transcriptional regulator with XRE-family HTH domain